MGLVQQLSITEFKVSVMSHTKPHDSEALAICDWALGLGGEAGEVLEATRAWADRIPKEGHIDTHMELLKEVGDILWYTTMLSEEVNQPLPLDILEVKHPNQALYDGFKPAYVAGEAAKNLVITASKIQEAIKHHIMHKEELKDLYQFYKEIFINCNVLLRATCGVHVGVNEAMLLNKRKLEHRYGGSGYSKAASAQRHGKEQVFKNTQEYLEIYNLVKWSSLGKNIILCGCDNAGKSTLAKQLGKLTGLPLRERIERIADPKQRREAHTYDLVRKVPHILDRCYFISDMVYEPLMSGEKSIFEEGRGGWELLTEAKAHVVFVNITEEACKKRYEMFGDELQSLKTILTARRRYEEFFGSANMEYIEVDNSGDKSPEEVAREIMNKILEGDN